MNKDKDALAIIANAYEEMKEEGVATYRGANPTLRSFHGGADSAGRLSSASTRTALRRKRTGMKGRKGAAS